MLMVFLKTEATSIQRSACCINLVTTVYNIADVSLNIAS